MYIYIRVPKLFGQVHSRDLLTGFYGMSFFYILEVLITDSSFVICVSIYLYVSAWTFIYGI